MRASRTHAVLDQLSNAVRRMHRTWLQITERPVVSVLALIARLTLAVVWIRFGCAKIATGWLTTNAVQPMVQLIAAGKITTALPFYVTVAQWTLATGVDRWISLLLPLIELAVGVLLILGLYTRRVALLAAFINLNLVLSGMALWQLDGKYIIWGLLVAAAGQGAGYFGIKRMWRRIRRAQSTSEIPFPTLRGPLSSRRKHVVIIGGGFAGLSAARELAHDDVDITLIDRTNHHLFQPLLYQVATTLLSPNQVAVPLRMVLRDHDNTTVLLANVTNIDLRQRELELDGGSRRLTYDYLVVAAGARHSYFGHAEWEASAPGLKTLDDAMEVRRRILLTLEKSELREVSGETTTPDTIVIIGGGPTGVELAGATRELAHMIARRELRRLSAVQMRVLLLHGGDRVLPTLDPELSAKALSHLEAIGVEVRTGAHVTRVTDDAVYIGEERIPARAVIWAAGNEASPLGRLLGAPTDRGGRVLVSPDLSIPHAPNVFVVGDLAAATSDGKTVPAVAPAAMQMGHRAAQNIRASLTGRARTPFTYFDKGSLAIVAKKRAVAQIGTWKSSGSFACLMWGVIHLLLMAGGRNRMRVFADWIYTGFTNDRADRLIIGQTENHRLRSAVAVSETVFAPSRSKVA